MAWLRDGVVVEMLQDWKDRMWTGGHVEVKGRIENIVPGFLLLSLTG